MRMSNGRRLRLLPPAVLMAVWLAGCSDDQGGDDPGYGPTPASLAAARAEPSGDGQTGAAAQDLATPLRIIVTRAGTPEPGAVVNWSATGTGGSMTPQVDTTGADGISSSIWHLGSEIGAQSSRALVGGGAEGSPVTFAATATGAAPNEVEIQLLTAGGNRFEPANLTIPAGTKVTWTWVGGFHDVTATGDPVFPSSGAPTSPPNSFSHTFNSAGTYLYFCSVHGSPTDGMRGTIVVQ